MRYLSRFNSADSSSISCNSFLNFCNTFLALRYPIFHGSEGFKRFESTSITNPTIDSSDKPFYETSTSKEIHRRNQQPNAQDVTPIVNSITEMIRTGDPTIHLSETSIFDRNFSETSISGENLSENSICEETQIRNSQLKPQNVNPSIHRISEITETENPTTHHCEKACFEASICEETHTRNPQIKPQDVSPMVHSITAIIRTENPSGPMENCLAKLGFMFDPDIVEKVLKRCFKVGHLALRFFNWVKLQPGFGHTTETYNCMLYIVGEAKEFDLVKKLLEEMEAEQCSKNIKTWTILISQYGKAKLLSKALQAFEEMKKFGCEPDRKVYKSIVCALCNAGKTDLAMEFYKEMRLKTMVVDIDLYKLLMNSLSRSGDIVVARLIGDDMVKIARIPEREVDSCMLKSFCIWGRIREALELVKKNKLTADPESFHALIKGLCRADRIDNALELVDIMNKTDEFDGKIYEILINGYLRTGKVAEAFKLFNNLNEHGHKPTVPTYTAMIQHLFRFNEYEKACKLNEEMLENGFEADQVVITAMVAGHVRYDRVSEAFQAFEGMKKKGERPTWKTYSIFIKELCKVSRPEEAYKLLNEMWDAKIWAGHELFRLVISCLRKKGMVEKAEKVEQMSRYFKLGDQQPQLSCLPVNHNWSSHEGFDAAGDTVESPNFSLNLGLEHNQPQPEKTDFPLLEPLKKCYEHRDLQNVGSILSNSNEWVSKQKALEKCLITFTPELVVDILFNSQRNGNAALQFFSWVGQLDGYSHTTETYNMAIKIAGGAKDFKHMRNLYFDMRRRNCLVTSNTWTIMLAQYGRAGLTEIALKKLKEMKMDKCNPNGSTYKYLIIFLCRRKGRKVEEAIEVFQEMMGAGFVPDKELVDIYLTCLCEVGKVSEAQKCVNSLCKVGFTSQICHSLLVKALCRNRRLDEALTLADEAGSTGFKVDRYIYGSLIHGLLREGRLNEALAKVEALKRAGFLPTVHVYTSLIVYFLKENQIGNAEAIFKKMREEGCDPTVITYSAMIRWYMTEDRFRDAWSAFLLMKLKGPFPDFKTYSMFITCLCRVGRSENALQLIYEMMEIGICPSTVNFRTVFFGLNREGKRDLAHAVLHAKWGLMRRRKFLM